MPLDIGPILTIPKGLDAHIVSVAYSKVHFWYYYLRFQKAMGFDCLKSNVTNERLSLNLGNFPPSCKIGYLEAGAHLWIGGTNVLQSCNLSLSSK